MTDRYLVCGDNHGDTESLRRVVDDAADEQFDYVLHVGDFTRAWREERQADDPERGQAVGVRQLREVEPLLADLDDLADHGLLWVYGNQDYFGDLDYDLDVGTEVPDDDCVTVGGQRFTSDPSRVDSDEVLVSHMEHWRLVDHFDGLAHFCGNTHRGRRVGRRLNSSFLKVAHPESGEVTYGGYFVVELDDDSDTGGTEQPLSVEMRSIGDLRRVECDRHAERGVQFQPSSRGCLFCRDEAALMREQSASAFYGLVDHPADETDTDETVTDEALVEYAVGLWDDPPADFADDFAAYLDDVDDDRYAPLIRTDDGRLTVAEKSYAY
jgi:predicted phosphodiesterase